MPADIAYLDAGALGAAFRSGDMSPVDVAVLLLDRIARLDPTVNSIVHVDREATLEMAAASETRHRTGVPLSALDGVPVTVKDLVAVAGMPLRRGSAARDEQALCLADAPCVARLREAGAVILGKTATPEAGCKVVTRSAVHGVTRNPHDLGKTPRGSSGVHRRRWPWASGRLPSGRMAPARSAFRLRIPMSLA